MERRLLLAVALSFAVVSLYGLATGQCSPPPPEDPPKNGQESPENGGQPKDPRAPQDPVEPEQPGEPDRPPPPPPPPPPGDEESPQKDYVPDEPRIYVQSPELDLIFTTRGGALEAARLLHAFEDDQKTPLDILVPAAADLLLGQIDDTFLEAGEDAPGDDTREDAPAGPLRSRHWTHDKTAEAMTPEPDVIFTYRTGAGGVWTKQWLLPEEARRYDLRLRISYQPPADEAGSAAPRVKLLAASGLLREPATGALAFQAGNAAVRGSKKLPLAEQNDAGFGLPDETARDQGVELLGARTHFFLATYYRPPEARAHPEFVDWWAMGASSSRRKEFRKNIRAFFQDVRERDGKNDEALLERIDKGVEGLHQAWLAFDVPPSWAPTAPQPLELSFYLGPIDREILSQDEYVAAKKVIAYPPAFLAPDFLAKGLLWIYDIFRNLFGNAGVGIILMTIVVRLAMMPVSMKTQLSMRRYSRRISKLKPKLDEIKEKFGKNQKRFREEQAKLYREHGVGFPSGCLMIFIQMPIWFALFSALRVEYTLRNASFLWISDLSGPDKLIDFGGTILDLGVLTIFSLNILPLLMVVLSIFQQRMMPKPADEQQAQQMRMMKWMPIIFAVILYNYTAALALYMVLSSAMAIVESRAVRWLDKEGDAGAGGAWPTGGM